MKRRVLSLLLCGCLGLSGCQVAPGPAVSPPASPSPSAAAPAPVRREFTLPLDPTGGWDPYGGDRGSNMAILSLVCESLFALDDAFEPQPVLATGGEVSQDGLSWTVRLREGVRFSDGEALNARRVCAAVESARGGKSVYAQRLSGIKKVSAQGESAVRFELKSPNAGFLALLDFPIAVVSGQGVVGTGPYVLEEDRLTAREGWWRGAEMPLESIPLQEAGDADALMAQFNVGDISVTAFDPTGPDSLGYSGSYQSWEYPTSSMLYLGFRCAGGPCKEAAFRRCVSQALDRKALVEQELAGHAQAAALPVHPNARRYDSALAGQLDDNAAQAAQTLDELGYERGEDGRRYSGRKALSLRLLVNSDNVHKERLAQAIQGQLEELGITVDVRSLAWEEYKKALDKGEFDLYLAECRLTGDLDPSPFLTPGSGLLYGGFRSAELSAALGPARATGEWGEFDGQWVRDVPLATLCFKTAAVLTQWGQVSGAKPTQSDLFDHFENWTIS